MYSSLVGMLYRSSFFRRPTSIFPLWTGIGKWIPPPSFIRYVVTPPTRFAFQPDLFPLAGAKPYVVESMDVANSALKRRYFDLLSGPLLALIRDIRRLPRIRAGRCTRQHIAQQNRPRDTECDGNHIERVWHRANGSEHWPRLRLRSSPHRRRNQKWYPPQIRG